MRASSLSSAWKLISRSTRSMAASAASIARPTTFSSAPRAAMCSSVPIAGRARRSSTQDDLVESEKAADAIGDMLTRQRCAADVGDIGVHFDRIRERLADELIAPLQVAN